MNTLDLEVFGEDERRIRKSNVRHIFTPHKPITDERFFRGRLEEMKQLLSHSQHSWRPCTTIW